LTIAGIDGAEVSRIPIPTHRLVIAINVARVATSVRQHFLKRDAVFFDVLVYSR